MSSRFCPNCGTQSNGAKFCSNCGTEIDADNVQAAQASDSAGYQPTSQAGQYSGYSSDQPDSRYFQQPPGYQPYQGKPDYIRPPNYQPTTSIGQRIIGTLKMDVDVVEEIEARPELQQEAIKLLIVNFVIIAIFRTLSVLFFSDLWTVYNPGASMIEIVLETFISGFAFVILIAGIGKFIGGQQTETDRDEMIRVLAYAYVARTIEAIISTIDDMYGSYFTLIWLVLVLYQAIVFVFVIRRALDKGYGTAIITIGLAFIGRFVVTAIIFAIVGAIFGPTYI